MTPEAIAAMNRMADAMSELAESNLRLAEALLEHAEAMDAKDGEPDTMD